MCEKIRTWLNPIIYSIHLGTPSVRTILDRVKKVWRKLENLQFGSHILPTVLNGSCDLYALVLVQKPFPKIVPMAKLHSLIVTLIKKNVRKKFVKLPHSCLLYTVNDTLWFHLHIVDLSTMCNIFINATIREW